MTTPTIDALEGTELSEAIAQALGWHFVLLAGWHTKEGVYVDDILDFTTPFGEHRLRAEIERLGGIYDIHAYRELNNDLRFWAFVVVDGPSYAADALSAATALGRAFLKAKAGK